MGRFASRVPLFACAFLPLALGGCAQMWDDLTAHSPQGGFGNDMQYRMGLLFFQREDPIKVLAESQDGDLRRRAYLALQYDGDAQQKELVARLLIEGAKGDKDLVCRLAAVERLAELKDDRAPQALIDAFYAPANVSEKNPVVRVAVVRSLGKRSEPLASQTIAEAMLRDPATEVRVAAARALGGTRDPQAPSALVRVLKDEKELTVRYEASASLQKITGKELPANAAEWEQYLQSNPNPPERRLTREPIEYLKQATFQR